MRRRWNAWRAKGRLADAAFADTMRTLALMSVVAAAAWVSIGSASIEVDASSERRSHRLELNERTIAGVTILDLKGRLTFTSGSDMGRRSSST